MSLSGNVWRLRDEPNSDGNETEKGRGSAIERRRDKPLSVGKTLRKNFSGVKRRLYLLETIDLFIAAVTKISRGIVAHHSTEPL